MNHAIDAFHTLRHSWKKYLLTMLGIAIGIAAVTIVRGIGNFGTQKVMSELNELGMGGVLISMENESGYSILDNQTLQWMDAQSSVENAMPILTQYARGIYQSANESLLLMGVGSEVDQMISLNIKYGQSLSPTDVQEGKRYCLIDDRTAQTLYGTADAVGQTISLLWNDVQTEFQIIGITEYGSGLLQSTVGEYIPAIAYIPYTTLQSLNQLTTFSQLAVRFKENSELEIILPRIQKLLQELQPAAECTVHNLAQQASRLGNLMETITQLLTAIAAISLLVACIGIMTNMMVAVRERRREIGIRKAIGAKRSDIILEFLWESSLLSLIGSGCGIFIGVLALLGAQWISKFQIPLNGWEFLGLIGLSWIVGIIFGVVPAFRAGNIRPIDAIRQDS